MMGTYETGDLAMNYGTEKGFSLIELLIVVLIIGIIAAIAIPQLLDAQSRAKQRRSMAEMRTTSVANGTYFIDNASYAPDLGALSTGGYLETPVTNDGWGNPYQYTESSTTYTLTSYGSDGSPGPAPPTPWENEPFEPDIIVVDGQFTQAPGTS